MKQFTKKIDIENASTYYQLSKVFNLSVLAKEALRYIERCFSIVCETKTFLEIDFEFLKNIIRSSKLHIDSELQLFDLAKKWLKFSPEARNQFANALLKCVRLGLLSIPALESLLRDPTNATVFHDIAAILKEFLDEKKRASQSKST